MDTLRTGIQDSTNILGLADLVKDTDDIISDVDIGELESQIIDRRKKQSKKAMDPDQHKSEIQDIMKGMKSMDVSGDVDSEPSSDDNDDSSDSSSSSDSDEKSKTSMYAPPSTQSSKHKSHKSVQFEYAPGKSEFRNSSWYGSKTQEEQAQSVISRVLGESSEKRHVYDQRSGQDHELEKMIAQEQEQDLKAMLLAQYDLLKNSLIEDRVDISRVPSVDEKSPLAHINAALRMLRHKNDLRRFVNIGEDFILMIAYGLESVFDGEISYFGYYPDLSGWSDSVKPRIRRMRADTSALVSSVMNGFNFGSLTRMGLELVPSAFLYSRTRRSKLKGQTTESEWKDSIHHLDDVENPKSGKEK